MASEWLALPSTPAQRRALLLASGAALVAAALCARFVSRRRRRAADPTEGKSSETPRTEVKAMATASSPPKTPSAISDPASLRQLPARAAVVSVSLRNLGQSLRSPPAQLWTLQGMRSLDLSGTCLDALPVALGSLAGLTSLELSRCDLTSLPESLGLLSSLVVLNVADNRLTSLPASLGELRCLTRLGVRGNLLRALPASIGGCANLTELFLTDNCLESLPETLGDCRNLVKLQASHNCLEIMPASLGRLPRLELLRLACNRLCADPAPALAHAPRLAWLSWAGNPCSPAPPPPAAKVPLVSADALAPPPGSHASLGDGASGDVIPVVHEGRICALKRFCLTRSPDGRAEDEEAIACALQDAALVRVLARLAPPARGVVMELVRGTPMALKPDHASLLRCKWLPGALFSLTVALRTLCDVSAALGHMHRRGVAHGDVYAHNVLVEGDSGAAVLCDYGASYAYDRGDAGAAQLHQALDVRAFGLFLGDLVLRVDIQFDGMEFTLDAQRQLLLLAVACQHPLPAQRPSFAALHGALGALQAGLARRGGGGGSGAAALKLRSARIVDPDSDSDAE